MRYFRMNINWDRFFWYSPSQRTSSSSNLLTLQTQTQILHKSDSPIISKCKSSLLLLAAVASQVSASPIFARQASTDCNITTFQLTANLPYTPPYSDVMYQ